MTRNSKKERELAHLRRFQRVVAESPQGDPLIGERPDFVLPSPDGLVGIELTEYFRPHVPGLRPLQEQDSLKNAFVNHAKRSYENKFDSRLRVQVLFRPRHDIYRKHLSGLAERLADTLGQLALTPDEHRMFVSTKEIRFPEPVSTIFARIVSTEDVSRWEVVAAGSVRPLSPDDLSAIIEEKDNKRLRYRGDISEVWLLIVQDWWSRASYAELTVAAQEAVYRTGFKRVYFLDVFRGHCTELHVEAQGIRR